ncbi:hypothetical protein Taro_017309 [Colocasia esculenta]|uniref:Uncharacterized protein n=1 Tax=Colocasia esculenta TaxID=4460 RepID=A0A843UR26_COLES|nr:hypothetical protein [Colocasia esculenta]
MSWPQRSPNPLSEIPHGLWGSLKTPVINKDHMLMVKHRSTVYIANKSLGPKTGPWDSPKKRSQNGWIACTDAKNNISQSPLRTQQHPAQLVFLHTRREQHPGYHQVFLHTRREQHPGYHQVILHTRREHHKERFVRQAPRSNCNKQ